MTAKRKRERLEDPEVQATPAPNYGARPSTAKVCATCGHPYINPCINPKMLAACPNAQWLASQQKAKKK